MQFAIEILQKELLDIRGIIRKIDRNEHEICSNIPHDNLLQQENELKLAIARLQETEELKPKTVIALTRKLAMDMGYGGGVAFTCKEVLDGIERRLI